MTFAPTHRRSLLLHGGRLMAALSLSPVLTACGGGTTDELRDPKLYTENQALRERAEAAVADGLVGAVYGSQHSSADKLYLGAAGKAAQ